MSSPRWLRRLKQETRAQAREEERIYAQAEKRARELILAEAGRPLSDEEYRRVHLLADAGIPDAERKHGPGEAAAKEAIAQAIRWELRR